MKLTEKFNKVQDAQMALQHAQYDLKEAQGELIDYLIANRMYHCLNINYSTLRRAVAQEDPEVAVPSAPKLPR